MYNNLDFISQFHGNLGIPIHARMFALALSKKLNSLNLFQLQIGAQEKKLSNPDLNKLVKKSINSDNPGLIFWYPNIYPEYNVFKKNIGMYVFEYTNIPKQFIESINQLDIICTPSKWGKETLIKNGVTIPVSIIPGGVDKSFNSRERKLFYKKDGIFRFLHIGKAEKRKGTELLIRAFNEAFRGDKKITLSLSIDNPHIPNFSAEDYLAGLERELKYPFDNIKILHYEPFIKELYDTHDCAVFPTMAEGIGLPIVEAMGCGLPVIVSNNTGITEYANKENAIILEDLYKIPVYDPYFFPESGSFGTWDSPKLEELKEKMIWVYQNQDLANKIGTNAERWIAENYTWDIAAEKFIKECLNED